MLVIKRRNNGLAIGAGLVLWVAFALVGGAAELRVPADYVTIGAALQAARAGDTILVAPGTYRESLEITKGIVLKGEDKDTTIIDGGGRPTVSIRSAVLVTVQGFTITGGTDGVFVQADAKALLVDNRIVGNKRDGVLVVGTAELRDNFISGNGRDGVSTFGARGQVTGSGNVVARNVRYDLGRNVPPEVRVIGGPPAPRAQLTPSDWTNRNRFTIEWTADYPARVVAVWYKVGSAPTAPTDGIRSTERSLTLESPAEGETPLYLWLEDELGQREYGNAARAFLRWDKTPPRIKAVVSPEPNPRGWHNRDVTVRFECSDATAGIATFTPPVTIRDEAKGRVITGEAVDKAGNRATASVTINLDKTSPTIEVGEPQGTRGQDGWFVSDVAVRFVATDNLSGFGPDGRLELAETKRTVREGEGLELSAAFTDLAGNRAEARADPFKVDKTPPTIQAVVTPKPNEHGWNKSDVTVRFECSDVTSGIATFTPPVTIRDEAKGQVIIGEAVDRAGNRATATVTINLDKIPPTGSLTINDGAATTTSTTVTLRISASDALSGISQMRFSNDGSTWSGWEPFKGTKGNWDLSRFGGNSSEGIKTVWGQVKDLAGNISEVLKASIRLALTLRVPQDFTSIQAAIDAAEDGCTILISPGTYTGNWTIMRNISFKGAAETPYVVTLRGTATDMPVLVVEGGQVVVENLTVTGGKGSGGSGILVQNKAIAALQNVVISNNGGRGVLVQDFAQADIQGCQILNNKVFGLHVRRSSRVSVHGSRIEGNGDIGILVIGSSQAEIRDNRIINTKADPEVIGLGDGIEVGDDSKATIDNNTISGSARYGIVIFVRLAEDPSVRIRPSSALIKNNTVQNSGAGGIRIDSSQVTLEKNVIEGNVESGVAIYGTAKVEVIDNRIQNSKPNAQRKFGDGITVSGEAQATIKGNTIIGNARVGIGLWDSAKAALQDNIVKDNKGCGIYSERSTNITACLGNTISGNRGGDYCGAAEGRCY